MTTALGEVEVVLRRARDVGGRDRRGGPRRGAPAGATDRRRRRCRPDDDELVGRLVLDDAVVAGRDPRRGRRRSRRSTSTPRRTRRPPRPGSERSLLAPGFVDVHVHGWGGHDAMGDSAALDGMARALLRRGVTTFLPTGVTAPLPTLAAFAERVRAGCPAAPANGARPLGFNLEGPFLAAARKGAHDPTHLRDPADVDRGGDRAAARRPAAHHDRPGAARRARPHRPVYALGASRCRWATRRRRFDEARAGLRGRRHVDDPPLQRDERRRPPRTRGWRSPPSTTTTSTSS